VGADPLSVIKHLCEQLSFSLSDAVIVTQSTPIVIRCSDDFIQLAQQQRALEALGASSKLKS
jgi:hypothetical protein